MVLSGYYTRTVDAPEAGALATSRSINNNVQRGAELVLTHRLTPVMSATVGVNFNRIQALASAGSERTTEAGGRAGLSVKVSPKTSIALGGSAARSSRPPSSLVTKSRSTPGWTTRSIDLQRAPHGRSRMTNSLSVLMYHAIPGGRCGTEGADAHYQ